ncbi:MAG TPA: hypothetical protein VLL52_18230 [Anaerolineae bacterium]|nr:hypothetical protein [Anaerolineae bacterium]
MSGWFIVYTVVGFCVVIFLGLATAHGRDLWGSFFWKRGCLSLVLTIVYLIVMVPAIAVVPQFFRSAPEQIFAAVAHTVPPLWVGHGVWATMGSLVYFLNTTAWWRRAWWVAGGGLWVGMSAWWWSILPVIEFWREISVLIGQLAFSMIFLIVVSLWVTDKWWSWVTAD